MTDYAQELLLPNMFDRPVKHYTQVINVTIHHFYITGEIEEEVDRYIDMINYIKTAEAHDQIYIYLNTPGGNLATTVQIIAAMRQSAATVITSVEGEVCSAGTMIFLSGDDFIVNDNCSFMIHNYSHGPMGKGNEVAQQVKFTEQYYKELSESLYKDFLTGDEIQDVLIGKDIWMTSDEIRTRLGNRMTDQSEVSVEIEEAPPAEPAEVVTPKRRGRKKTT